MDDVKPVAPAKLSDKEAVTLLAQVTELLEKISPEQAQALLAKTDAEIAELEGQVNENQRALRVIKDKTRAANAPLNARLGQLSRMRLELAKRAPTMTIGPGA